MTDEQKQRISILIGEIEAILNGAKINADIRFDVQCTPLLACGESDRSVYGIELHVMGAEIVRIEEVLQPRRS